MDPVEVKIGRTTASRPLFPEVGSNYREGSLRSVGILEAGMTSGKASLWLNIQMKDGSWVCVQVSAGQYEVIGGILRGAVARFAAEGAL